MRLKLLEEHLEADAGGLGLGCRDAERHARRQRSDWKTESCERYAR
jgi:hypothetical protein